MNGYIEVVVFSFLIVAGRKSGALNNTDIQQNSDNSNSHVMKIKTNNGLKNTGVELNFTAEHSNQNSTKDESSLKMTLFPPDLHRIFLALKGLPNGSCKNDSRQVLEAVVSRERWALKMFDSSPKFPVGMLYGSYYQLGNFDECVSIKESFSHPNRVMQGQYCLADIALNVDNENEGRVARSYGHFHDHQVSSASRFTYNDTLRWAICVPSSCSPKEVELFLDKLFKISISYKAVRIQVPKLKCHYEKDVPFTALEIVYGSLVGVFLVFVFLATIYHLVFIYRRRKSLHYNVNVQHNAMLRFFDQIILSFSLIRSIRKLIHKGQSELTLDCIFGIKFIFMMLIIASHSLLFLTGGPVTNEIFFREAITKPQNALLLNNPLLVDTFLLIGSFLLCRLLLLELDKRKGKVNPFVLYFGRYLRLTPSYLVVIGLYCTYMIRLDNGPLWDDRMTLEKSRCIKSWWANILYINNYVNTDNICMFQSWYLSVDTQMFAIAPLFIYPLWKWPRIGEALLGILTFLAAFVPFLITYIYELDPTQMAYPSEIVDISVNSYFVFAYIKTHMRGISYSIGLIAGYIVHQLQSSNTKIPQKLVWLGWTLAIIFGMSSLFSITIFYLPQHEYSPLEAAAYSSLHKIAWSMFIAWIIISCATGNSDLLHKFLSWAPFVPFSRLTYCAYLVNGLIALHNFGTLRQPVYMSVYGLAATIWGQVVLTFAAGFILCVLFESPIHSLEKCVLQYVNKSTSRRQADSAKL